nr:MAG TPA: hypothetical protein [Caudoviricetes sp.]
MALTLLLVPRVIQLNGKLFLLATILILLIRCSSMVLQFS